MHPRAWLWHATVGSFETKPCRDPSGSWRLRYQWGTAMLFPGLLSSFIFPPTLFQGLFLHILAAVSNTSGGKALLCDLHCPYMWRWIFLHITTMCISFFFWEISIWVLGTLNEVVHLFSLLRCLHISESSSSQMHSMKAFSPGLWAISTRLLPLL